MQLRRRPEMLGTAIATAFFWPTSTTSSCRACLRCRAELKLIYTDRSLNLHGSAWLVLEGSFSRDKDGGIVLTPDFASIEELLIDHYIAGLKHDLERARNQAKRAFEAAKTKPPRDPFLD